MVSRRLFWQLNQNLIEIFNNDAPFGGLSVIVFGDLYQLPPVNPPAIYSRKNYNNMSMKDLNVLHLWELFRMVELTEVMRQRGNPIWINVLNKIRLGEIDENVESTLISKFVSPTELAESNLLHIFAEKVPVHSHNEQLLNDLEAPLISVEAIDELPADIHNPEKYLECLPKLNINDTGNFPGVLTVKRGAKVIL